MSNLKFVPVFLLFIIIHFPQQVMCSDSYGEVQNTFDSKIAFLDTDAYSIQILNINENSKFSNNKIMVDRYEKNHKPGINLLSEIKTKNQLEPRDTKTSYWNYITPVALTLVAGGLTYMLYEARSR